MPKYRYMVVHEGVLEADDKQDAENVAYLEGRERASSIDSRASRSSERGR